MPEIITRTPSFDEIHQVNSDYPTMELTFRQALLQYNPPPEYFRFMEERWKEFPVFAAIVTPSSDGNGLEVVSVSGNMVNTTGKSTRHAEIEAIEKASEKLGKHLRGCTLITTVEPCAMCASAIVHSECGQVIFGAFQQDMKDMSFLVADQIKDFRTEPTNYASVEFITEREPRIKVIGGYLRNEVITMMNRIFDRQV